MGSIWLPLSAWKVRGFDTERIEKNTAPENKKWDDVLGELFRVQLESDSATHSTGWEATEHVKRSAPLLENPDAKKSKMSPEDLKQKVLLDKAKATHTKQVENKISLITSGYSAIPLSMHTAMQAWHNEFAETIKLIEGSKDIDHLNGIMKVDFFW